MPDDQAWRHFAGSTGPWATLPKQKHGSTKTAIPRPMPIQKEGDHISFHVLGEGMERGTPVIFQRLARWPPCIAVGDSRAV